MCVFVCCECVGVCVRCEIEFSQKTNRLSGGDLAGENLGYSKVPNLEYGFLLVEHYVLCLQVSVKDVL